MNIRPNCIIPPFFKGNNARSNTVNSEFSHNRPKLSDINTVTIMKYDFNYKYTLGKQIQLR